MKALLTMMVIISGISAVYHMDLSSRAETVQTSPEPPMVTRGLREPVDTAWQGRLIELRRQDETNLASLIFLQIQEPIHIDGSIPLWGLVTVICGSVLTAIIFGITLRDSMKAHEELDNERFKKMTKSIDDNHTQLRQDIAGLRYP